MSCLYHSVLHGQSVVCYQQTRRGAVSVVLVSAWDLVWEMCWCCGNWKISHLSCAHKSCSMFQSQDYIWSHSHYSSHLHICLMIHVRLLIHFNHCLSVISTIHQPIFRTHIQRWGFTNSLTEFLKVDFHGTLQHTQYMNTSIHTLQPHNYHKTELIVETHKHNISLDRNNNVVSKLLSLICKNTISKKEGTFENFCHS